MVGVFGEETWDDLLLAEYTDVEEDSYIAKLAFGMTGGVRLLGGTGMDKVWFGSDSVCLAVAVSVAEVDVSMENEKEKKKLIRRGQATTYWFGLASRVSQSSPS